MSGIRFYTTVVRYWRRTCQLLRQISGKPKTIYVGDRVSFYKKMWREAADQIGLTFQQLSDIIWEIRDDGEFVTRVSNYLAMLDDPVTLKIAGDKVLTYKLLSEKGLSIPPYTMFSISSLEKVRRFIAEHDGPFVVKPARGTSAGLGVTTNLRSFMQCAKASALASIYCEDQLIERFIVGESYRLLFVGQKLIRIARRRGSRVTGNGDHSLARLVADKYPEYCKKDDPATWSSDGDLVRTIIAQGLTLQSVPARGEHVLVTSRLFGLDRHEEIRTIYTEDVTNQVCREIVEDARQACSALRSEFAGVDIITTDPSVPLRTSNGAIVEVNSTPGLHHHYGLKGDDAAEPAATEVLRYILNKKNKIFDRVPK